MRSTGWSAATAMWGIRESIRRSTAAGSPPSRGARRCPERKRTKEKTMIIREYGAENPRHLVFFQGSCEPWRSFARQRKGWRAGFTSCW